MLLLSIVIVAGFVNGSFAMPSKWMTEWKEESIWLSFSLLGMFILPLITVFAFIPDLEILFNNLLHSSQMLTLSLGGTLFGIGQICFARAFRLIGIGLNFAISISISTVCVALVELFMEYQLFFTWYAFFQMAGASIFLLAITMGTIAGIERGKVFQAKIRNKWVIYGIILSVIAGIGAACQGIAFHLAGPKMSESANAVGVSELSINIVAWAIILLFGFIPYATFFLYLIIKNQSWPVLMMAGTKRYWFFALLMGLGYWVSLLLFSSSNRVSDDSLNLTITWPLFMIFIVLTSNFWSWISGEWRNASMKAVKYMKISIGLFVSAVLFFSFNTKPNVEASSRTLQFVNTSNHKIGRPSPDFTRSEFLDEIEELFSISLSSAQKIIEDFHDEMRRGLSGAKSSLNMAPSFIDLPQGNEKGEFIALDLGGTNFRILAIELDGKGNVNILSVKRYVIEKAVIQGTGEELFDFIAVAIRDFMTVNEMSFNHEIKLGFTFSFPVKQENIASGILLNWTKGFSATGVVGQDVVNLLYEALLRQSVNNVQVSALILDAVATLATESYRNPLCKMSVILGTGTDACYLEEIDNIKKINFGKSKESMMVNLGWGNFDKLPQNVYDAILDSNSLNPGQQKLEKLVSGMYLGEILRLVMIDLIERGLIFKDKNMHFFSEIGSITTEDMSLIERDASANLGEIDNYLRALGVLNSDLYERKCFQELSRFISVRSARLSATLMMAVVTWMDPQVSKRHIVGVDGSLFERYHNYETNIVIFLSEFLNDRSNNVTLGLARDGSGIGAAIIAAM